MNKRLKKELRGERRGGREGHRERKRKRRRESEGEEEEEEEEGEIQKKTLTDVAHAVQRASTVCIVRRSPSPLLLCPCLPNSPNYPPPLPTPLSQYTSRKRVVAAVQGKDAIMSGRQRSISPWLFIGLPER